MLKYSKEFELKERRLNRAFIARDRFLKALRALEKIEREERVKKLRENLTLFNARSRA